MKEKEAMESPLHKVWEELFTYSLGMDLSRDHPKGHAFMDLAARRIPMLRRVLLERCAKVADSSGVLDRPQGYGITNFIPVDREPWLLRIMTYGGVPQHFDKEACLNMASAFSFWAWELEQREKDGSKVQA